MFRYFFCIVVFIMLSGCSTFNPKYSDIIKSVSNPSKNKVRLFFYRTNDSFLYGGRDAAIEINNETKGYCSTSSFFYYDITAGKHTLNADVWDIPGTCKIVIEAVEENTYYFEVTPRWENFYMTLKSMSIDGLEGLPKLFFDSHTQKCSGGFALMPRSYSEAIKKLPDLKIRSGFLF